MFKDNDFLSLDTSCENLCELSKGQLLLAQRRIVEISLLAKGIVDTFLSLYNDGLNVYEIKEALFVAEDSIYTMNDLSSTDDIAKQAGSYIRMAAHIDKAVFAERLVSLLSERGLSLCEGDYLSEGGGDETFVYVKNRLADEAYDVFSQDFSDPRVFYAPDFRSAIRAVLDDKCEYCLLPLEEKGGVRIPSISSILYSSDLKINSVRSVFGPDGAADMRYALVSKHFSIPPLFEEDDRYIEVRLGDADTGLLSELFAVADYFGISIYRINSALSDAEDASSPTTIVFSVIGKSFVNLLTYLSIFYPTYTVVGIYSNLE